MQTPIEGVDPPSSGPVECAKEHRGVEPQGGVATRGAASKSSLRTEDDSKPGASRYEQIYLAYTLFLYYVKMAWDS